MTRPYIKKNVEFWDLKRSRKETSSASTHDKASKLNGSNHGEETVFKRKVGRPRKEERGTGSCSGSSQDKHLKLKDCNAHGEKGTSPTLKRKVGRPRKIESEASNQTHGKCRRPVKKSAFVKKLRGRMKLVRGTGAGQTQASKQTSVSTIKECSPMRSESSTFLQSKKKLALKYKKSLPKTKRKNLRSAHPAFKDSATKRLRSRIPHGKEETIIKSRKTILQSLKKKQEAALAKMKKLEENIPISHLTPIVELDTDDVLSSAWLPLAERQPLSMEKRMMFRGCDPSHKCCQQRAVEMFDNCTQWEDPTYLYKMLSDDQSSPPTCPSPTSNTDTAAACGQLVLNQNPETEAFTLIQQASGQHQLFLQQNLSDIGLSQYTALQSHNPEASLSDQVKNNILFQRAQSGDDLEYKLFQQDVKHKTKSRCIPRRRRGRKRKMAKPVYQSEDKNHLNLIQFPLDSKVCDWDDSPTKFTSEQFIKNVGMTLGQQSSVSTNLIQWVQEGNTPLCSSEQKCHQETTRSIDHVEMSREIVKLCEQRLVDATLPPRDLNNPKSLLEVHKSSAQNQLFLPLSTSHSTSFLSSDINSLTTSQTDTNRIAHSQQGNKTRQKNAQYVVSMGAQTQAKTEHFTTPQAKTTTCTTTVLLPKSGQMTQGTLMLQSKAQTTKSLHTQNIVFHLNPGMDIKRNAEPLNKILVESDAVIVEAEAGPCTKEILETQSTGLSLKNSSPSPTISSAPVAQHAVSSSKYYKTIKTIPQNNEDIVAVPQKITAELSPQVACTSADYKESRLNYPTVSPTPQPLVSIVFLDSDSETES